MLVDPRRQARPVVELNSQRSGRHLAVQCVKHRIPAFRQRRVGNGALRADDDVGAAVRGKFGDALPKGSFRSHLVKDRLARHILRLDLKTAACCRNVARDRRTACQGDAHIDAAVRRVLVAAPGYTGGREAVRTDFLLAKARDELPQVGIPQAFDLVGGYLEQHLAILREWPATAYEENG